MLSFVNRAITEQTKANTNYIFTSIYQNKFYLPQSVALVLARAVTCAGAPLMAVIGWRVATVQTDSLSLSLTRTAQLARTICAITGESLRVAPVPPALFSERSEALDGCARQTRISARQSSARIIANRM